MDFFKRIWNKINTPHGIWLALFYILFALLLTGTILLVILVPTQSIWHYLLYVLSAIGLCYFIYTIVYFTPIVKNRIIELLKKNKLTSTLLYNYGYRTLMTAIFSSILNLAYLIFMGVIGIISGSAWHLAITAYYLVLFIMKGNIFLSKKKHGDDIKKQAKNFKITGILFIVLMIAFSGVIVLIYKVNMYFEYAGLMIYAVALYTFVNITIAIVNLFKARRQDDLHVKGIRNVNFANALISIIVLQVAMFQAFSPEFNKTFANGLTGGVVAILVIAIGTLMIYKSNKILKQEKNNDRK